MGKIKPYIQIEAIPKSVNFLLNIVAYLLVALILWFAFEAFITHFGQRKYKQDYAVMIDAGSVHTSLYVYKYPSDKPYNSSVGNVEEIFSCEVSATKGISSVPIDDLESYIFNSDCVKKMYEETDLLPGKALFIIGGTAGLRGLEKAKAKEIIFKLQQILKTNAADGTARILSSAEEGVYGWLSVNYLINGINFNEATQVGSLDWGGGSSEITFASQKLGNRKLNLFNTTFKIFTRSDQCFGQSEAVRRYYALLLQDTFDQDTGPIEAPCQPLDNNFTMSREDIFGSECTNLKNGSFRDYSLKQNNFEFYGSSNHSKCRQVIKRLFDSRECSSTFSKHCFSPLNLDKKPDRFFAFSTYFYTGILLNLNPDLHIHQSKQKSAELCESAYDNHPMREKGEEFVQNECFRGVFMNVLIEHGYGFNTNQTTIKIVDKVQGQNVGWTLGYALDQLQKVKIVPLKLNDRALAITLPLCFIGLMILFLICVSSDRIFYFFFERRESRYEGI